MARIYLTENFANETIYLAIDEEKIETLAVSDTYDQFGQSVSAGDAGDYLFLNSQKAADFANAWEKEEDEDAKPTWAVGEIVAAHENWRLYDALVKAFEADDIEVVRETCQGFNYWDGHNYQTVTVGCENDEPTHEIVDDEEIIARLEEALANKEFVSEGGGYRKYSYKDAEITFSQFAGAWEEYSITLDNDFEEEEEEA